MTTVGEERNCWWPSLRHYVTASPSDGRRTALTTLLSALLVAAAVTLAGCDYLGFTPIRDIAAAPAQFEGKEVKIKGKAADPVQLLSLRMFTLKDEAGEITVTTSGSLPAAGTEVAVKGTVKSAVIFGGKSLGLRVEETKRLR